MYQIRSLHAQACRSTSNVFLFCNGYKSAEDLSVWRIPFKDSILDFILFLHAKLSSEDFFILCYWFCIIVAVVGLVEAIWEFIHVYSDEGYEPKTFWNRNYCHIPVEFRRKGRILGSILNVVSNILLLYGFTNFRHAYIYPWILTNGAIIALEAFYGISTFLGNKIFHKEPFIAFTLLVFRFAIVLHMSIVISELTQNWLCLINKIITQNINISLYHLYLYDFETMFSPFFYFDCNETHNDL